jgi:hypothetical protein
MGKLTTTDKLDLPLNWYFEDARYNRDRSIWTIQFPNTGYPYSLAIHYDIIYESEPALKIQIRKWVEENLDETVFMTTVDNHYWQPYSKERP